MSDTLTYLSDDDVLEVRITEAPFNRSVSGYGRRIPTQYMLKLASAKGRWHRVYAMCYGNGSSAYVDRGGKAHFLAVSTEYRIKAYETAYHKSRGGLNFPPLHYPHRNIQPVRIDSLAPGDRFCFHYDGVASTLLAVENSSYRWHDYKGEHRLHNPSQGDTADHAWPYVYATTEPETEVKAA